MCVLTLQCSATAVCCLLTPHLVRHARNTILHLPPLATGSNGLFLAHSLHPSVRQAFRISAPPVPACTTGWKTTACRTPRQEQPPRST